MLTVNERINEMARTMCGCYHDGKCSAHHNAGCASIGSVDCISKQKALSLFRAGYIHISESKNIVKQAKIDILNEVKEKCAYSFFFGQKFITERVIDELIKEAQNEQ